jgi:uncharacterized protein (DUF2384 family)
MAAPEDSVLVARTVPVTANARRRRNTHPLSEDLTAATAKPRSTAGVAAVKHRDFVGA